MPVVGEICDDSDLDDLDGDDTSQKEMLVTLSQADDFQAIALANVQWESKGLLPVNDRSTSKRRQTECNIEEGDQDI